MDFLLPDQLRYLEPVLYELSEMSSEELEDGEYALVLERVLRARISGLTIREAQARIEEDRDALKKWLKADGEHKESGQYLVELLSYRPGPFVRYLLSPEGAEARRRSPGPTVSCKPGAGWTVQLDDDHSSMTVWKDGQKIGVISAMKMKAFGLWRKRMDADKSWVATAVRFGECHGSKYVFESKSPAKLKTVRYFLEVPGGAVECVCGGAEFEDRNIDEGGFEAQLHTVHVTPEPSP